MKVIDHTTADFNKDVLVHGYYLNAGGSTLFYGRDAGKNMIHVIVSDDEGWYEYTAFNQYRSVERFIDIKAADEASKAAR